MNNLKDAAAQFEDLLKEQLKSNVFPEYSETLATYARVALQFESQATLGCGLDTYESIFKGANDLYTASFAINCVQARTPEDLKLSLPDYIELQNHITDLAAKWNGYVEPLKGRLARKIQTQVQISKGVPDHKKIIGIA